LRRCLWRGKDGEKEKCEPGTEYPPGKQCLNHDSASEGKKNTSVGITGAASEPRFIVNPEKNRVQIFLQQKSQQIYK
jgi:hypothetical protein